MRPARISWMSSSVEEKTCGATWVMGGCSRRI
jgi:hypothetical protein